MKYASSILTAAILGMILFIPALANADWSESWTENGIWGNPATQYRLDKYEVFIVSDPVDTQLVDLNTTLKRWTSTIISPTYGFLSGRSTKSLDLSTTFSGLAHDGLVLDLVAWSGNDIVGAETINVNGIDTSLNTYQELDIKDSNVMDMINSLNRNAVPLPNAAWLLATGLIGLISVRRKQTA
jgi:hypothetical protein